MALALDAADRRAQPGGDPAAARRPVLHLLRGDAAQGRRRGAPCSRAAASPWACPGPARAWCRRPSCSTAPRTSRAGRRATVTTVVNPTGPLNLGLVAYLSFYDALGDKCSPSYTLQRRRPGRGQLRAGVRRDRAGARPGGAGVRRHRARLRGPRPALGGRPRVRLEHPRQHPRHRELPRHAQQPEGRPVRLLRRLDRRRVGQRARAVVRPGAQHRRHRDRRHPGPPRAQPALRQRQRRPGPA